ncbi:hypothetical protein [Taibaiella koreensis]|uniref:hypothetical protein n=1 Tax=Taibaiella koreensis TaxID=1268548 RepID=UPI0013C2F2AD|nr:hypothetical protein [Taibaiella koreensis]
MKAAIPAEERQLILDCLKQRGDVPDADLQAYLRGRKVSEQRIPAIVDKTLKVAEARRLAKTRMQEGGVVTTIGLGGVAYAATTGRDGTAWLLWSMVGLGILASGWWKRKRSKQYN